MPARVDPVKLTISIPGCAAIALPTVGPSPCTRLKTPAGTPAASRISAKIVALPGHSSDGFSTIVLPAAHAVATFRALWLGGPFNGVIMQTTNRKRIGEGKGVM